VSPNGATGAGVLVAVAGVVLAAGILQARDTGYPEPPFADRLLYVESGAVVDRLALSFDPLVADVYWIRTIQHYGRDRKSARPDRFALLAPLLGLTTTLDPHFTIAYRFGAFFLALNPPHGAGRVDQAVALLEKGLRHDPEAWQYAHDIGFIHYLETGDCTAAARWFERAGGLPGAPEWLQPLAAVTLAEGGDRDGARQLLQPMLDSPDEYIRAAAELRLLQLQTLDMIDELDARVEAFAEVRGQYPASLNDLGLGVVADAAGTPFAYDPVSHQVLLARESRLGPLPRIACR